MKNFKKIMALIVAMVMIVGTMSVTAFAENGNLTADADLTISGLEDKDDVDLYQVFKWTDGVGWELTDDFNTNEIKTLPNIAKIIANDTSSTPIELQKAEIEALTTQAKTLSGATASGKSDKGTFTESGLDAGMYLALVTPAKAGTVYNPIIVSVDFVDNTSNTINASTAIMGSDSTVAKKDTVDVTKRS